MDCWVKPGNDDGRVQPNLGFISYVSKVRTHTAGPE
jgi:hypothetical protein